MRDGTLMEVANRPRSLTPILFHSVPTFRLSEMLHPLSTFAHLIIGHHSHGVRNERVVLLLETLDLIAFDVERLPCIWAMVCWDRQREATRGGSGTRTEQILVSSLS